MLILNNSIFVLKIKKNNNIFNQFFEMSKQSVMKHFANTGLPICYKKRLSLFSYLEQNKEKLNLKMDSDYVNYLKEIEKEDIKLKETFNNVCFCEKHHFKSCQLQNYYKYLN